MAVVRVVRKNLGIFMKAVCVLTVAGVKKQVAFTAKVLVLRALVLKI